MEVLEVGDIVTHLWRVGFFRVEELITMRTYHGHEYAAAMIRKVGTKGLKMRRDSIAYPVSLSMITHAKRGIEELENRLNQLNPLI